MKTLLRINTCMASLLGALLFLLQASLLHAQDPQIAEGTMIRFGENASQTQSLRKIKGTGIWQLNDEQNNPIAQYSMVRSTDKTFVIGISSDFKKKSRKLWHFNLETKKVTEIEERFMEIRLFFGWGWVQIKGEELPFTIQEVTVFGDFHISNPTDDAINVFKQPQGSLNKEFVETLLPGKTLTIETRVSEKFVFENQANGHIVEPSIYEVLFLDEQLSLDAGVPFKNELKSSINEKANHYSFDVTKLDPIFIDYQEDDKIMHEGKDYGGGGMRKPIFEELAVEDLDWRNVKSDITMKNHFDFKDINTGTGSEETKMTYSSSQFGESFSVGIGVSAGVAKVAKSKNSGTYKYSTSTKKGKNQIYTFSKHERRKYEISLVEEKAKLHQDFIEAINDLPVLNSKIKMREYKKFVEEWGTHYPVSVTYGGMKVGMSTFSEESFEQAVGHDLDLKNEVNASVKALDVGRETSFGFSRNESFKRISGKSKKSYFFIGGNSTVSGVDWLVKEENSQPVGIELKKLSLLLKPELFQQSGSFVSSYVLGVKKGYLENAIEEYLLDAPIGSDRSRPRVFRLTINDWEMINEEDGAATPRIYGYITISSIVKSQESNHLVTWETGSDNPVLAPKKHLEPVGQSKTLLAKGKEIPQSRFVVYYHMRDKDDASSDDIIGMFVKSIVLPEENQSLDDTIELRSDDGDIDIHYTIEELPIFFDSF